MIDTIEITPTEPKDIRRLLDEAEDAGHDTIRIVLARKAKVPPSGTVRLYGRSGPSSSEDHKVERLSKEHVAAVFRVIDLHRFLRASDHHCHAIGCSAHCKPEHLMCAPHWRMVPAKHQQAVYRAYRPGQCDDMDISRAWLVAAETAIAFVALCEGKITSLQADRMIARAREFKGSEDETPTLDPYALLDRSRTP